MKKKLNIVVIIFLFVMVNFVFSQERLFDALGYESFYNGISFKKAMQNNSLQLILGMFYETERETDDNAELDLRAALRVRSKFWDSKRVKVEKFIEGGIIVDDTHQEDVSRTNIHVSVGFIPEVFVTEKFSFEIPLGIGLVLQGESRENAGDNSTRIETFGRGLDLNISFHVYF
ncbi:MAG: hypothetical protein RMJ67_04105 [Elusimicrobiota bacterium]|nr:hypothetical protein [Endomicrobiia bacterium]MDW8165675.1 hypothetical protein [Elusimicrobiota bacterium]